MDVCILTAGRGTRLGAAGQSVNKGLLPIRGKAALTHLIERFPAGTRFVVAVGHLAAQVEEYLRLAHPDARFELVPVMPFEGPGSGPGMSALCCEPKLPGPFFLVCSDTWWPEEGILADEPASSVAWTADVPQAESRDYCNLEVVDGQVRDILDKSEASGRGAWVGLAFVREPARFFDGIRGSAGIQGELQLSGGLKALMRGGRLETRHLEGWHDLGTAQRYARARDALDPCRFDKEGELFFHVGSRVLKFFSDPMIVENRVRRARLRPELFPEIVGQGRNLYAYRYLEGQTLYDCPDPGIVADLLAWLTSSVWLKPDRVPADFRAQCLAFYRARTEARLERAERALPEGEPRAINGMDVPRGRELLARVPWEVLAEGIPAFIHGDLQLDNIVVGPGSGGAPRFHLIDWRQDFAGSLETGDLYYDFAKLLASIQLDFRALARGEFQITRLSDGLLLEGPAGRSTRALRALVEREATGSHALDLGRLRLLIGLVYLNMAGLHSGDQARLLYHQGRLALSEALSGGHASGTPTTIEGWTARS